MVYVLKDNRGNYVGENSISWDEKTKECIYSHSDRLTNGFYTFSTERGALEGLKNLEEIATTIGLNIKFHINSINIDDVITYESNLTFKKYPIVHEVISMVDIRQFVVA